MEIQGADDFQHQVARATEKMTLIHVREPELNESKRMIGLWLSPVVRPGLMSIHMATVSRGWLYLRPTSCYQDCCYGDGIISPNSWKEAGWQKSSVRVENSEIESDVWSEYSDSDPDSEDELPLATVREDDLPLARLLEQEEEDIPLAQLQPQRKRMPRRSCRRM